jgi:hypothetical protein
VTVPANITTNGTSQAGAVVSYAAPTANDPDEGPLPVSCVSSPTAGLSSGSTFPYGTTTIDCTSTDRAGNQGTGQFTVTVNDTPPTISGANNINDTTTDPTGKVETFNVTATDKKDGSVPVSCSPVSGTKFPVGTTTVNCSASNSSGQTSAASFTVTITLVSADSTPPVLAQHANIKVNATSPSGAVVSYTVTATDPDNTAAQITISCVPASGSTFPLASGARTKTTTVTCNAHDPAGNNAAPMSFSVTVLGVHDQIVALEGQINAASNLGNSVKKQLVNQLVSADVYFWLGSKTNAKASLNNFIKKVGQRTPPVTSAQNTAWIGSANTIIAVIGA